MKLRCLRTLFRSSAVLPVLLAALALAVCVPSGFAEPPAVSGPRTSNFDPPQSLVIVTVWQAEPGDPRLTGHYESELRNAMDDLGLRTRFVSLEEATSQSFSGRIVVLRMVEDTAASRRHLASVPSTALAWTHAPDGSITPFGIVDLAALRRFLGSRLPAALLGQDSLILGRALGRVSAHEIFHMITRSKEHSPRGLMQVSLTVDELTRPHCPEWLPSNKELAHAAFPQALTNGVVAALHAGDSR